MADEDKKSRKSGVFSLFRPRLPRIQRSPGLRVNEEYNNLKSAISSARRTCPHDGSLMAIEIIYDEAAFEQTHDGEVVPTDHQQQALVCPECGFTVSVEALAQEAIADAAHIKRAEIQLMILAFTMTLGFSGLAFLTGNILTLIGGVLGGTTIFVRALFLRYRHWQAINRRLFETTPPIGAWIKAEVSGK